MPSRFSPEEDIIVYMKELRTRPNRAICMTKNGDIHEIDVQEGSVFSYMVNIGKNSKFTLDKSEQVMVVISQDL